MLLCCKNEGESDEELRLQIDQKFMHNSISNSSLVQTEFNYDFFKNNKIGHYQKSYKNQETLFFWNEIKPEEIIEKRFESKSTFEEPLLSKKHSK